MAIDAERILAYSCPHAPYWHSKTAQFLKQVKQEIKPTIVVCLGDLADLHSFSRWPKNPNCMGPGDEVKAAKDCIRELASIFPRQLVCWSNHDKRIEKHAVTTGTPKELVKTWQEVFSPPAGWRFAWEWEVGPALAIHGDR